MFCSDEQSTLPGLLHSFFQSANTKDSNNAATVPSIGNLLINKVDKISFTDLVLISAKILHQYSPKFWNLIIATGSFILVIFWCYAHSKHQEKIHLIE